MATIPTLLVNSVDQTDFIQHKTLGFRLKYLDFTLVDPTTEPVLHNIVTLDEPAWRGRVSTIEAYPFKSANGDDHRLVKVTATNKHVAVSDTSPFDLSDTPNYSTTFPFKDMVHIRTLEDQSDLASAEHRLQATIYEPGIVPGMTMQVTCAAESLTADSFIVTEMTVSWLRKDAPEFRLEASENGEPPITLGGIIDNANCDCPPFTGCEDPDVGGLSCLAPDSNIYSYTEGGMRSAFGMTYVGGNYFSTSTDFGRYYLTGDAVGDYPDAGVTDDVGNGGGCCGIFTDGIIDYHTGGSPFHVRLWVIGPGTMTINTAPHPGGQEGCDPDCGTSGNVSAGAARSGTGGIVASDTQSAGTPLTLVIPDDDTCAFYIDVNSPTGPWGYGGANWTPLSTFDPCEPSPGQPIVPEHFSGDGSTDTFGLAWPYMPGSLVVLVEGVDWSDQVIETDPTIGDFSLAYPPPLATDPEPNVEVHYRYPK